MYGRDRDRGYGGYGGRDRDRGRDRGYGRPAPRRNEFGMGMGQPGASLKPVDWSRLKLEKFEKHFFFEHPAVKARSQEEVDEWLKKHVCAPEGNNIPKPVFNFNEASLPDYILSEIARAGFVSPTPIQSVGWPMALTGRDVVGIAKTGSGKTLAFIIPAIIHINAQPLLKSGDGPIALIVAPTRELACQIEQECVQFGSSSGLKIACVYGGVPKRKQETALRNGIEILICTPGRLLDFLERGTTNLRRVTYLVFDEADRMLDMGFEPQIRSLVSQIRPDRQVLMWSATWPKEVESLASDFLPNDLLMIRVGSAETQACDTITQVVRCVSKFDKENLLNESLRTYVQQYNGKVLVFTATKRMCDQLARGLNRAGWFASSIHGDKRQEERDRVLADFKDGRCNIMIATDVASRGIHVNDITCVVNYDFPGNIEDYVHRIGRTGRAGKTGIAISFFDASVDGRKAGKLVKILENSKQEIPAELRQIAAQNQGTHGRRRYKDRSRGGYKPYSGGGRY